jgi:phospholipid/cholesterol/gamma-HCH transport system permease protein
MSLKNCKIELVKNGAELELLPQGRIRLADLKELELQTTSSFNKQPKLSQISISGDQIESIDTAGVVFLIGLAKKLGVSQNKIELKNIKSEQSPIFNLVFERLKGLEQLEMPFKPDLIGRIGRGIYKFSEHLKGTLTMLGECFLGVWEIIRNPKILRKKEFFVQLETVCLDAIPVITLVTALIGVVIAYLSAIQIEKYGANIFIVDAVALAMCRELSPIIVAIIVAGRSGSAFTAQLGTMKLYEEIDAISTLGLSPLRVLIIPRILAIIIALPLLVFVGDIVGIAGSMLIAERQLDITVYTFIERLRVVLPLNSFYVGLIKAPVFALFIGVIGCRMGLAVEKNARSVGLNTTSTVVQSIVAVILLNAGFAVLFQKLGI